MPISPQLAKRIGFEMPGHRGWITPENLTKMAMDSALVTQPNSAIPAEFTAYYDPMIIDILTAPLMAREVFTEVRKGDWTTAYARFRVNEITGKTEPYSDFGQSAKSGTNYNWLDRDNYIFQTFIQYGDYETALSAEAKINYVADKQRGAATVIDIDANKFYLRGVAGKRIYGLLNDPSLSAPSAPLPSGTSSSIEWKDKGAVQIFDDIKALFSQLVAQSQGHINAKSKLTLNMSPDLAVYLLTSSIYNQTVQDMLTKNFPNMKVVLFLNFLTLQPAKPCK